MVIGSGSGNSIVDRRFADLDVAIVEHGVFGGTCINVGCIPTKMYVYPADIASTSGTRAGSASTPRSTRCAGATSATASSAASTPSSVDGHDYRARRSANVTLYDGHARFTGPKQIAVEIDRASRPSSPPTAS